jgi:uncharacterized protein
VSSLHIAVFCRPLLAGVVKTRLIPAYGAEGATRIYEQLVMRTLATVRQTCLISGGTASLWVAGDMTHHSIAAWSQPDHLDVFGQAEGDLGEKMLDCLRRLQEHHARVVLIGTDCPALTPEYLCAAEEAMTPMCPWVFGPVEDGGYALVGSSTAHAAPFTGIAWSTPGVMAQTRAALRANQLGFSELPMLWDVDEPDDVKRAREAGLFA